MNRIIKFLLISVVIGGFIYLLLEIYKLKNKIKLLTLQLQTKEQFDSSNQVHKETPPQQLNSSLDQPSRQEPSEEYIQSEILEYEKELEQVDQLINQLHKHSTIDLKTEHLPLDTIEEEINTFEQETNKKESNTGDFQTGDLQTEDLQTGDLQTEDLQTGDFQTGDLQTEDLQTEEAESELDTINNTDNIVTKYSKDFGKTKLKDLCKENSLSKKGTKKDLILRLIQHKCLPESIDSTESTTENNNNMSTINDTNNSDTSDSRDVSSEIAFNIESIDTLSASIKQDLSTSSVLYKLQSFNQQHNYSDNVVMMME